VAAAVFISHSSRDKKVAETLCQALEARGLTCWISSRDIGPGENFQEAIVKALRGARAMVLVFTANANNSDEIKKEMALASQNRLAIIPVRVEDVMPSDAFAYEFATRQWVDVFGDWDRAVTQLAGRIREFMGDGAAPRPAAPPPAPAHRSGKRWAVAAVIGVVILAAAGGGYAVWSMRAAAIDVSGDWTSPPLTNPYDQNEKSILTFELHQRSETLFGTVSEAVDGHADKKGIRDGQTKDGAVTFFTQGMTTPLKGGEEQSYKEIYHGLVNGAEIDFIRQNDLLTGGIPEKFIATRK
jgi:hypothetical protein